MGLFEKAIQTYDNYMRNPPPVPEGHVAMAPVAHMITRADIEIVLDKEGNLVDAVSVDKNEPRIIISATEGSAGRTKKIYPHPLCELLGYLMPSNEAKYNAYVKQLEAWTNSSYSHPKLAPVLSYVKKGTIFEDLLERNLPVSSVDKKTGEVEIKEKLLIRWRILGEEEEACWLDRSLYDAFTNYYLANLEGKKRLCMITGEETVMAVNHPKGIVPFYNGAKLISSNDDTNFTYRGFFEEPWQAASVGYEATQKAHNALKWLVQDRGVMIGGRVFICWNPKGDEVIAPDKPLIATEQPIYDPGEYRNALREVLSGRMSSYELGDEVIIASFSATTKTTGRLSVTYYGEIPGQDMLQRLYDWDSTICWPHRVFGIRTPTLRGIVNCAFGSQRKGTMAVNARGEQYQKMVLETDDAIMNKQMQHLISCRVDKTPINMGIVRALANRASHPEAYDRFVWEDILFTACAVIRKYRTDRFEEVWSMALEPEKQDRSYQFGRLLAVMEKAEWDTYSADEDRDPNAIRYMNSFSQRPMHYAGILEKHLEKAYFRKLETKDRIKYKNMISQIMAKISEFPEEEWNKPLENTFLMGYYLQRNELFGRKPEKKEN